MTRKEQIAFVNELITNVCADLLERVEEVPEEWDGHELRQWIADRFQESSFTLKQNKRRYRDYKKTVASNRGI